MKLPFYKQWYDNRLNKIFNILGEDWFVGKSILELGACHGDFGMEFIEKGAKVTFCEVRREHLESIKEKLEEKYPFLPGTPDKDSFVRLNRLDQNFEYNLGEKYDLVLHFGTLYHIENWRQDLKSALEHTNLLFLETVVNPDDSSEEIFFDDRKYEYEAYNCKEPLFTQKHVEEFLSESGCKFIRFDDKNLNSSGWASHSGMIKIIYDWNSENFKLYQSTPNCNVQHRRFWLILK